MNYIQSTIEIPLYSLRLFLALTWWDWLTSTILRTFSIKLFASFRQRHIQYRYARLSSNHCVGITAKTFNLLLCTGRVYHDPEKLWFSLACTYDDFFIQILIAALLRATFGIYLGITSGVIEAFVTWVKLCVAVCHRWCGRKKSICILYTS
jgi:hypothetical protein